MQITVDYSHSIGELKHFWNSTGFTPASLLLNADMRQNMAYAGSIPNGGLKYIRIHYLLELVSGTGFGTENVAYDWSILDQAMDVLIENNLIPIFELMGNPSRYFNDMTDDTVAHAWKQFVRDLALHYIDRYGLDDVRKWYFETWNEPDIGWWKQSSESFMIYYDGCSEGLKEADPELILGGPGSARTLSPLFREFLAHCDSGTNYFTGETGTRLDFISVHEKGVRASPEDLNPNSMRISNREAEAVEYIRQYHPRLAGIPFMNNECDPQVGWKDFHTWRGRTYHAAIACKIINQHILSLVDNLGVNYTLLSNDHGFMGQWGNRTLLARFGDIEDRRAQSGYLTEEGDLREDLGRRKFESIKKPVLNVMALLSLLGDKQYKITDGGVASAPLGILATARDDNQVAILVYHSEDKIISSGSEHIKLTLDNLPFEQATLAHYRLDDKHGNPFDVWEKQGAPRYPTQDQYLELRQHHEPTLLEPTYDVSIHDGSLVLEFDMPLPSVSLILLSTRPDRHPEPVTNLRLEHYDGLSNVNQVMVKWDEVMHTRFIQTYEVYVRTSSEHSFERVNTVDTICTAFLHVPSQQVTEGEYMVRSVDYWGRSADSSIVQFVSMKT